MAFLLPFAFSTLLLLTGMSLPGSAAVGISVYWFRELFIGMSHKLPIKEIMLSFYSLQFLLAPAFVYNGLEDYVYYRMKVSQEVYFSLMIPAFLSFTFGITLLTRGKNLRVSRDSIHAWVSAYPRIPYYMIAAGFLLPLLTGYLPSALRFFLYLLGGLKYVGLFILILSHKELKPLVLAAVYGSVLVGAFAEGMFHDLLIWLVMLGCVLAYRYKPPTPVKVAFLALFTLFVILIQSIKSEYRKVIWTEGGRASLSLVNESARKVQVERGGLLSFENLAPHMIRINQGWILASAMNHVPASVPHSNGILTKKYLESAILPRFLAKNKLEAGDKDIFNLYSGHYIRADTSMGLGMFTDAYVEFGSLGAIFYVFVFGLLYGFILSRIVRYSPNYPILILFATLIFLYPIRPDCETQTVLGHLAKSSFLIYLLLRLFRRYFYFVKNNKATLKPVQQASAKVA